MCMCVSLSASLSFSLSSCLSRPLSLVRARALSLSLYSLAAHPSVEYAYVVRFATVGCEGDEGRPLVFLYSPPS